MQALAKSGIIPYFLLFTWEAVGSFQNNIFLKEKKQTKNHTFSDKKNLSLKTFLNTLAIKILICMVTLRTDPDSVYGEKGMISASSGSGK